MQSVTAVGLGAPQWTHSSGPPRTLKDVLAGLVGLGATQGTDSLGPPRTLEGVLVGLVGALSFFFSELLLLPSVDGELCLFG